MRHKKVVSIYLVISLVLLMMTPLTVTAAEVGGQSQIDTQIKNHMVQTVSAVSRQAESKSFDVGYTYSEDEKLYQVNIGQGAKNKGVFALSSTGFATALIDPITLGKKGRPDTIPENLMYVKVTDANNESRSEKIDKDKLKEISKMSILSVKDLYQIFAPNGFSKLGDLMNNSYKLEYHFELTSDEYVHTMGIKFNEVTDNGFVITPDDKDQAKEKFMKGLKLVIEATVDPEVAEVEITGDNIIVVFANTEVANIKKAANELVKALQADVKKGTLKIKSKTFDLKSDNVTSEVAKTILDGINPDEFLKGNSIKVDYTADVTVESDIPFDLAGELIFVAKETEETAKDKFLEQLAIDVAQIDVAEVTLNSEDISVIFAEDATVQNIKQAAADLVTLLRNGGVDGTLEIGDNSFNLADAGVETAVANAILNGISPEEFLKGKSVELPYGATISVNSGTPFKLEGMLKFAMPFEEPQPEPGELKISGGSEVNVGETIKLTATLGQSNVTDDAQWESSDEAVATVAGGQVTGVAQGSVTITATLDAQSGSYKVTVKAVEKPEQKPDTKPEGGGSGGGGSSSSSGGHSRPDSAPSIASVTTTKDKPYAANALKKDLEKIQAEIASGKANVAYRAVNYTSIPKDTLAKISALVEKENINLTIHFDTVKNKAVVSRLSVTFKPGYKAEDTKVTLNQTLMSKIESLFSKHFKNNIQVVSLDAENLSCKVAVKLDKSLDKENIVLYSYNAKTNKYQKVDQKVTVDKNGYAHFEITEGQNFILSNGGISK